MLAEVERYIRRERMLEAEQPVLVAVSGGVDSMVLLHVLRALGHPCEVAHVDHGLRGAESDADRAFVEEHCRVNDIPFRVTKVDPKASAKGMEVSVQMAGRELRYAWFAELLKELGRPLAMGHHRDDATETLFINLLRGTGAHGWASIPPVSGNIVRPLLCVDRDAILTYAREDQVQFREDSSNADPKYLRNRIRHELLPLIEAMRPGAHKAIARSVDLLRETDGAAEQLVMQQLAALSAVANGAQRIPFDLLEGSTTPTLLLYHLLRHRGFHPDAFERIREAIMERSTGAMFSAGEWCVCVDRDSLVIDRSDGPSPSVIIDPSFSTRTSGPFKWRFVSGPVAEQQRGRHEAILDMDRLSFPLELRPWREADRIRPIGLGGSKRVSDILINAKVPQSGKKGVYVLVSGSEIIWLVGHRVAEGFQATATTAQVLAVEHNDRP